MNPNFILNGKRVAFEGGINQAAVIVQNGKIDRLVSGGLQAARKQYPHLRIEDAGELVVFPGLVDTHVHVNEPGRTEWEGFLTATQAAASGGVTTFVDMPLNCIPVTTSVKALETKRGALHGKLSIDCAFFGGVVPGNVNEIGAMAKAGVKGFKAFMTDSGIPEFPQVTENDLRNAMPEIERLGLPLLVHAELETCIGPRLLNRKSFSDFVRSRPDEWERAAIDLLVRLCRETRCPTHVVHLSSATALDIIRRAKDEGLPFTAETCPHYLLFCSEEVPDGDTRYKCMPPIRSRENAEKLWSALNDGTIDFITSDHSPCPPELKQLEEGDFEKAWGGISSVQFSLSTVWTEAARRKIPMERIVDWCCSRPARFVGLGSKKGEIRSGFDADFIFWDPNSTWKISPAMIYHRHKLTPYESHSVRGVVNKVFLRGLPVYDRGRFLLGHYGEDLS